MKEILTLLGMFIAGVIFTWLRPKIFKKAKKTIVELRTDNTVPRILNASIGNAYKKNGEEVFQVKKFVKGFGGLFSPVGWAKDFIGIFNVRKLTIYIVIISVLMGWSYWKGQQGKPVYVDIAYGKEIKMALNDKGDYLHIHKNGTVHIHDKNGTLLKKITVSDIPGLKRKLRPIGFQIEPIAVMGVSAGMTGISGEAGVGISWLKYWKWRMDAFITNRGFYPLATSYRITDNSGAGLGMGYGWAGDTRGILYYNWKF